MGLGMSERTLLASVVLFRELYDSDKDVYDVIAEFIKASLLFSQRWSVNTTEATHLLESEFELTIPEAVVGTTLHKRLYKRDSLLSFDKGTYSTSNGQLSASQPLVDELKKLRKNQEDVLKRLTNYVENTVGPLNEEQRELLAACFCDYLFDQDTNTRFSENISAFIITSQEDASLTAQLNAVREGFVLYDGVRHSPDLSSIANWRSRLVVFLDTEHLFNAVGMNGSLHKQLFSDFSNLVSDVRGKDGRMISLRYFSECADEVERFFRVAEHIIDGKAVLDPSKPAMVAILEGCSSKGDVLTKKARFFADLKSRGIHPADPQHEAAWPEFNVESSGLLQEVRNAVEGKGREFHEEKCLNTLRMFTKINSIRQGNNVRPFEEVGAILISGSHIANFLAFHPSVRSKSGSFPYSSDLEFVTNRLWFKLHKNLAKGIAHPQSLNIVAKAQVVLSSQLQNSVSDKFDQIKKGFESGEISEEETKFLFNNLRSYSTSPEALNATNVESALTFLDHKDYEHHLRERSALEMQAEAGRSAVRQLNAIRAEQGARRRRFASMISLVFHLFIGLGLIGCILAALICSYRLLATMGSGGDDRLAILGILVTLVVGIAPLTGYRFIRSWMLRSHSAFVERIFETRA
jgi:hypothetical protein